MIVHKDDLGCIDGKLLLLMPRIDTDGWFAQFWKACEDVYNE